MTGESSSEPGPAGVRRGVARSVARRFAAPIPSAFYDRPTRRVAVDLLGTTVVHRLEDGWAAARVVETEAYLDDDPASHAFRGPTRRNASMFGPPGTLYVFRIHQVVCANVVTRPGQAVLLRAGAPVVPEEGNPSGPGRLTRFLGIGHDEDGNDLVRSDIRLLPREVRVGPVTVGPRVGISKARDAPLRFSIRGDPWVSRPRPSGGRVGVT